MVGAVDQKNVIITLKLQFLYVKILGNFMKKICLVNSSLIKVKI